MCWCVKNARPLNVISEGRLMEAGCTISKEGSTCVVKRNNIVIMMCEVVDRLAKVVKAYDVEKKGLKQLCF